MCTSLTKAMNKDIDLEKHVLFTLIENFIALML